MADWEVPMADRFPSEARATATAELIAPVARRQRSVAARSSRAKGPARTCCWHCRCSMRSLRRSSCSISAPHSSMALSATSAHTRRSCRLKQSCSGRRAPPRPLAPPPPSPRPPPRGRDHRSSASSRPDPPLHTVTYRYIRPQAARLEQLECEKQRLEYDWVLARRRLDEPLRAVTSRYEPLHTVTIFTVAYRFTPSPNQHAFTLRQAPPRRLEPSPAAWSRLGAPQPHRRQLAHHRRAHPRPFR